MMVKRRKEPVAFFYIFLVLYVCPVEKKKRNNMKGWLNKKKRERASDQESKGGHPRLVFLPLFETSAGLREM